MMRLLSSAEASSPTSKIPTNEMRFAAIAYPASGRNLPSLTQAAPRGHARTKNDTFCGCNWPRECGAGVERATIFDLRRSVYGGQASDPLFRRP